VGGRLVEQPAPGAPADTVCHLGKAQHDGLLAQAFGTGR
jgi:hypothetical protein